MPRLRDPRWWQGRQRSGGCTRAGKKLAGSGVVEHTISMLLDEQASPEQIEILRRMTPEQRWQAAHRLHWTMRRHKAAFLQSQHPDWSEQRVDDEVRRIFSNART